MTAPKLTPLPKVHPTAHPWRQPAPHSACTGTGEGKEQPMNKQNQIEGFHRWNAISNGCIESAPRDFQQLQALRITTEKKVAGSRAEHNSTPTGDPTERHQGGEGEKSPRQRGIDTWGS